MVIALLVAEMVSVASVDAGMLRANLVIDPEVRGLVSAGRARVLVVLQVDETSDQKGRAEAIGRAQDAVLSRLLGPHASVVRRYASVPVLALEIDATGLRILETMADIVVSVKLDRILVPQ
jgi:hypothetical protein